MPQSDDARQVHHWEDDRRVIEHWCYDWPDGRRTHGINAGDRRIQISISPKGRSIRIWVDGEEVPR